MAGASEEGTRGVGGGGGNREATSLPGEFSQPAALRQLTAFMTEVLHVHVNTEMGMKEMYQQRQKETHLM